MVINYEQADAALKKLNRQSPSHYYWDGWTICKFDPAVSAMYDPKGIYIEERGWGFLVKYEVNQDGSWTIDS